MKAKQAKPQQQHKVRCADCRYFHRDTEGISHNIATGVYFMGVCSQGQHPDSPVKQFADKERECSIYKKK